MAKETGRNKPREDPVATALVAPDTPVNAEPASTALPARRTSPHGVTGSVVDAAADTAHVVQRVLPHRTPVYLGGAALLVLGLVDLPVAAGGALVYEALRRWHPSP